MMKNSIYAVLAGSLALLQTAGAAVSISAVGDGNGHDITGTEAQSYRSTNIAKTFDADGDGAYGTSGYLVFGGAASKNNSREFSTGENWVSSNPSYVTTMLADDATTVTHRSDSYNDSKYDDPAQTIGADVADFGYGAILLMNSSSVNGDWYELMTFDVDNTVTNFRLGIMSGQDNDVGGKFDPSGFRISFEGGAAVAVNNIAAISDTIGMVFFDITTAGTAGTFSIEGQRRTSHPSLAGVTFDAISGSVTPPPAEGGCEIVAAGGGTGYDLIGSEVVSYYTTSVVKSLDVDGNNRYGTAGYLVFGGSSENNGADYGVNPSTYEESVPTFVDSFYADTANTLVRNNSSQTTMDDPSAAEGTDFPLGGYIMNNGTTGTTDLPMLSFSVTDSPAVRFRLGVFAANIAGIQYQPTALRLSFDDSNADTEDSSVNISSLPTLDSSMGVVFFDVELDEGTSGTFTIAASERSNNPTIAGVTFDVIPASPVTAPLISEFSTTHALVDAGDSVSLSWNVFGADSLRIDQDVGFLNTNGLYSTGSTQVTVNAEITYTLTATNGYGISTAEVGVSLREPRPNILIVMVDDMGTEDTSVNFNYDISGNVLNPVAPVSVGLPAWSDDPGGNSHYRTPAMETLAARGMKFSRAYAQQVCSPTRCSLMTGMNSARHGTIQWLGKRTDNLYNVRMPTSPGLVPSDYTLAEILRDYGYRTIISGKGHMGDDYNGSAGIYETASSDPDNDFYGFQVNISASDGGAHGDCYSDASNAFGLPASGPTAGLVAEYQDMTYSAFDPVTYTNGHPLADEPIFVTEAITHELIERIEDSVDANMPFFAYYSHFALHAPHDTDPRYTANYPEFADDYLPLAYATMVEGMDKGLSDVLAALEELGVAEDTLVIFLGDNGSDARPRGPQDPPTLTMTNPLRGEKGMRYEGGIRVPLIISWAKRDENNAFQQALPIPADSREDDLVVVQDLFPTILAAANIPLPDVDDAGDPLVIDGHDLAPYLREEAGTHRPQNLITHAPCGSRSSYFTTFHDGMWKLLYSYVTSSPVATTSVPLGTYELFDLASDPYEAVNLASTYPERVMSMARDMVAELEGLNAPYPILRNSDSDLAGLGLPSSAGDVHPVIMPVLPAVDVDGDGLADNSEDPNRNGLQDVGETAADNADSDGDSTNDGGELALGLDPLDSGSYFYLNSVPLTNGIMKLTWPSQPGTIFEIRGSTNLVDWSEVVVEDISAADPGSFTSYDLPSSTESHKFYRIGLK